MPPLPAKLKQVKKRPLAPPIALLAPDTETTGIDHQHGARPYYVSMYCREEVEPFFWEWYVDPETRKVLVEPGDLDEIQDYFDRAEEIVFHNSKFDVKAIGLTFRDYGRKLSLDWDKVHDTLYSSHLLGSNLPKDLTTLATRLLRFNIKPFEDALEKATKDARKLAEKLYPTWRIAKAGLAEMPSAKEKTWKYDGWLPRALAKAEGYAEDHPWRTVLQEYANPDPTVTLHIFERQREQLRERGLEKLYEIRRKLFRIVYDIENQGVTLSKDRLKTRYKEFVEESGVCGRVCNNIATGLNYELTLPKSGNNKSLTSFVFDALKLPVVRASKKTGAPSLDKKVIEHYEATLPQNSKQLSFIQNLASKRKYDTAISYMEGYDKYALPVFDGREQAVFLNDQWQILFPSLNPTGTDTLRWSSNNPNEQNISKQEGFSLRYIFGPLPGREWWSLDYENLELRIPAYESGEEVMIEIFEQPDEPPYFGSYHLLNASIVYPDLFWPLADQKGAFKKKYASTWYQWIKNFGFSVSYGAMEESGTADRAAHKVGAHAMVLNHLKKHAALNQRCIRYAEHMGYVETLPDKTIDPLRGYPLLCTRSKWGKIVPTVPLNYRVQGTAMWCTMKAMIRCQAYLDALNKRDPRGYYLILQVHDECVFDFPAGGKANLGVVRDLKNLMEESGDDIGIPLKVSYSWHPDNWGEESIAI